MAPAPSSQNGKSPTNGVVHDQVKVADSREKNVRDLVTLLSNALNAAGTEDLTSLIDENMSLKRSWEDERAARRVRDIEFRDEEKRLEEKTVAVQKLQEEVTHLNDTLLKERKDASDKISKATKEHQGQKERADDAEKLYTDQLLKIKEQETAIDRAHKLEKKASDREAEANRKIQELETELKKMKALEKQVMGFQSYGLQTKTVQANASECAQALKGMFDFSIKFLRELVFDREMDFTADSLDAWEMYKQNKAVIRLRIPLPDNNSLLAKQMRFASALALLGRVLRDQIFQPVYSSTDNDWVMTSLRSMAENDETEREHHLRSMLLKISPEEHGVVGRKRAKSACEQAKRILKLVVAEDQFNLLEEKLSKTCEDSFKLWSKLQRFQEHIVPDLELGSAEDWMPLPLPGGPNTQGSGNNPNRGNVADPGNQAISRPRSTDVMNLSDDDAGPTIWPVFTAEEEVLCYGYYLKHQQIQEARREQREAEDVASKRNFRRLSRSSNGGTSKKNNALSFLSKGSS